MIDEEDDDLAGVCRDESCTVEYVHPSHVFSLSASPSGRPPKPWWLDKDPKGYKKPDAEGLKQALERLFSSTDFPLAFREIEWEMRDSYGSVSERTLHRAVEKLVASGLVTRLDLRLTYKAYIRHDSRLIRDHDSLRENMISRYASSDEYLWRRQKRPGPLSERHKTALKRGQQNSRPAMQSMLAMHRGSGRRLTSQAVSAEVLRAIADSSGSDHLLIHLDHDQI